MPYRRVSVLFSRLLLISPNEHYIPSWKLVFSYVGLGLRSDRSFMISLRSLIAFPFGLVDHLGQDLLSIFSVFIQRVDIFLGQTHRSPLESHSGCKIGALSSAFQSLACLFSQIRLTDVSERLCPSRQPLQYHTFGRREGDDLFLFGLDIFVCRANFFFQFRFVSN